MNLHTPTPKFKNHNNNNLQGQRKTFLFRCSAVGNVSGNRWESDCRSRGCKFDPSPVPYFRVDWSGNFFYGHSPTFPWIIQEGLLSGTSKSMCRNYWLTACSSLPRKSVVRWTDRPTMTIDVDLGRKATKQNKKKHSYLGTNHKL